MNMSFAALTGGSGAESEEKEGGQFYCTHSDVNSNSLLCLCAELLSALKQFVSLLLHLYQIGKVTWS